MRGGRGWVAVLALVGMAGTLRAGEGRGPTALRPMADLVIRFPDAQKWAAMTRGRAKYAVVDVAPRTAREEEIAAQLARPISFDFQGAALQEAVDFVRDFSGVNVVLDRAALQEEGVSGDSPVTLRLSGVTLRSALRLLLDPLNLTFLVRDEVLFVTSKTKACSLVVTRVYPVADLVVPIPNAAGMRLGGTGPLGGGFSTLRSRASR